MALLLHKMQPNESSVITWSVVCYLMAQYTMYEEIFDFHIFIQKRRFGGFNIQAAEEKRQEK